jgi:uncharacterized phosphosugar-binding protein
MNGGMMKSFYDTYFDTVMNGFSVILKQTELIRKAGAMLAKAKIAGGKWVLYDFGYAMSLDTWTRGSNPCHNYIFKSKRYSATELPSPQDFKPGDCLILGSYRSDDPDDFAVVQKLREAKNTKLITISPHKKSMNPRTEVPLYKLADIAIDNGSENGGGNFNFSGVNGGILSYARDINLTINQAIIAEYIQCMVEAGCPPTQFYMVHFPYFKEIQDIMWKRIKKYGY